MNLQHRIDLLGRLGEYILSDDTAWQEAKIRAGAENGWFIPGFVDHAATAIATNYLSVPLLETWAHTHQLSQVTPVPMSVGIVMAGNIPLVGFHDLVSVFISGHRAVIKPSSKDSVLIRHLVEQLIAMEPASASFIQFAERLNGCDAYIATGSNNSSRYFEYYFSKYPHIIRGNRSSLGVITGRETARELEQLADDVNLYFGLGCRNVTKLLVPDGYDFVPLLDAFRKYDFLADNHRYKNNYDYNLALHLLNKKFYMTNGAILLVEEPALFSPISQLNYEFYSDEENLSAKLPRADQLQCMVGTNYIPFGAAQSPSLNDYADGIDTLAFLVSLGTVKNP